MNIKFILIFIVAISIFSFGIGINVNFDVMEKLDFNSTSNDMEPLNFMEQNEINDLIDIDSIDEITNKRSFLIDHIWNDDKLSKKLPDSIEENFDDDLFLNINNLEKITKLEIISEHDINSISYLFFPQQSNNKLVIYHQGHGGDFSKGIKIIEKLLSEEYTVLALSMPLTGKNNQPIIEHEKFGKIKLMSHNHLQLLKTNDFNPIKLFLEPINVSINYLDSNFNFESYSMMGISGGGWTTIVYSAIDERISKSFSVAGSYPFFLRSDVKNFGDYEQNDFELYSNVNYLELYVLGASGNNRSQTLIYNEYDRCCFSGNGYELFNNIIQKKIFSGNFEIYLDESQTQHIISEKSLDLILEKLNYTIDFK
jgi:hypothetical protein